MSISTDPKVDDAVAQAVSDLGASPRHSVADAGSLAYAVGFRNCQTFGMEEPGCALLRALVDFDHWAGMANKRSWFRLSNAAGAPSVRFRPEADIQDRRGYSWQNFPGNGFSE